jgi:hypothetical protein
VGGFTLGLREHGVTGAVLYALIENNTVCATHKSALCVQTVRRHLGVGIIYEDLPLRRFELKIYSFFFSSFVFVSGFHKPAIAAAISFML